MELPSQYEYHFERRIFVSLTAEKEWLNGLGENGWELIQVIGNSFEAKPSVIYYFKRNKTQMDELRARKMWSQITRG